MNLEDVRRSTANLIQPLRDLFQGTPSPPTLDFVHVLEAENRHLSCPGLDTLDPSALADERSVVRVVHGAHRSALCLSGGGIRSASFAIGVMEGLARAGVLPKFDYLSTVSGGGYAGSWLSAWLHHNNEKTNAPGAAAEPATPPVCDQLAQSAAGGEPEPLRHVREYSRYLDPKMGLFSVDVWTLIATVGRNLLINWLILLPLLAAALLLPRLYYAAVDLGAQQLPLLYTPDALSLASNGLLACVAILSVMSLWYITSDLPSMSRHPRPQGSFIVWCLGPAATANALLVIYWAWNRVITGEPMAFQTLIAIAVVVHLFVWVAGARRPWYRPRTWIAAVVASSLLSIGLWWIEARLFPRPLAVAKLYTAVAFPLVLLTTEVAGAVFIAISSMETQDEDREWWARAGGWLLIVALGWLGTSVIVLFGPDVVQWIAIRATAVNLTPEQAKSLLAIAAALSGGLAARAVGPGNTAPRTTARRVAFGLAAPLFVILAMTMLSWGNVAMLDRVDPFVHAYDHPRGAGIFEIGALLILLAAGGAGMGFMADVNRFSLFGMYRNRLIRTFLGASRAPGKRQPNPFTGFDPDDNVKMWELRGIVRPLHVINIALNIVATNRLAWQDRKAESFTVTALHSGSRHVGYRPSDQYGNQISLGGAMTLSGAAVAPNQGGHSAPALSFLLTLFNARLGAWLGNPGRAGAATWRLDNPKIGPGPLISEMFGRTTDTNPYVYLSDGGHFDNLALYEMVLRRCHYIVVSDAGCDGGCTFEDLGNAIRKVRIDLGIPITFTGAMRMNATDPLDRRHCAVATIDYRSADGTDAVQGFLVYIKPVLSGDEPIDVLNYSKIAKAFPHEPTTNQWFGEAAFESYRVLGVHSVQAIAAHLHPANAGGLTLRDFYLAAEEYSGATPTMSSAAPMKAPA